MAKSMMLSTTVAMLLAVGMLVVQLASAEEADAPGPAPLEDYGVLEECAERVTPYCEDELYKGVFNGDEVSLLCCHNLVLMGKKCSDMLVDHIFRYERPDAKPQEDKVWHKCAVAMGVKARSPSSS